MKKDNPYEQFMKEPEKVSDRKLSPQEIEDGINKQYDDRFNNTTSRRYASFNKSTSNGYKRRSNIYILTAIRKLFVYTKNYFKYGYFGD